LTLPVDLKGKTYQVYVRKRPFLEEFLSFVCEKFEVVVFTASLPEYADVVINEIDPHGLIHHRLFRQHCTQSNGFFVKDLALLGRPLSSIIIVDNSPASFLFHPDNAIQCTSWFDDCNDTELQDYVPLMQELGVTENVVATLDQYRHRIPRA
jgi:RNA polymerase II subunit A small phosphatase-like protein